MKVIRDKIIEIAQAELGTKESPGNSNLQKYGEWYGMNGVSWCAIFVSWVYHQAGCDLGHIDTDKGYHYCPSAYNFWKRTKQITQKPQAGDIILYDWTGNEFADHTGIFIKDNGNDSFVAIEGNTSINNNSNGGEVMERIRKYSTVLAFVSPICLNDIGLIKKLQLGDSGEEVKHLQILLNKKGAKLDIDGDFGKITQSAVIKFQQSNGLYTDGIVGEITLKTLNS